MSNATFDPIAIFESYSAADLLEYVRSHYFGLYRGVVTNNQDPEKRARLEVQVSSLFGATPAWAEPCVPYAGPSQGFYSLPPVGAGVWVQFEAGDPNFPVWIGCFWGSDALPDKSDPTIKIWKTEQATIRIDDSNGEIQILNGAVTIKAASDLAMTVGNATETISSSSVKLESGAAAVEVGPANVNVNNGALTVL